jgi:hypothetical protein
MKLLVDLIQYFDDADGFKERVCYFCIAVMWIISQRENSYKNCASSFTIVAQQI